MATIRSVLPARLAHHTIGLHISCAPFGVRFLTATCSTASAQQECLLSLKAERRTGNNVLQTVAPERAAPRGTSQPGAQSQAVVDREKLGDCHVRGNLASAVDGAREHRCLVDSAFELVESLLGRNWIRHASMPG